MTARDLRQNQLFNAVFAGLIMGACLFSGNVAADDLSSSIVDLWDTIKTNIIPVVGGLLFLVGGAIVGFGEGKMIATFGKVLMAAGFIIFGPTIFGFNINRG